ncbi:MAG: XRE family transcriptional regulator [Deltaproteobacteria bacterium]|nr:MAG: XRE family transcriptional regulator [Deltaproteobacteria bacterium]
MQFDRQMLSANLRRLRAKAGLSQHALAEAAGLSSETVSRVERGAFEPSLTTAAKLAGALGISLDALVGSDDATPVPGTALERRLVEAIAELPPRAQHAMLILAEMIGPRRPRRFPAGSNRRGLRRRPTR